MRVEYQVMYRRRANSTGQHAANFADLESATRRAQEIATRGHMGPVHAAFVRKATFEPTGVAFEGSA